MKKIIVLAGLLFIPFYFVSNLNVAYAQTDANTVASNAEKTVKAIEVKGNKTISLATILSKIKTRVSQPYLQSVISEDLKRLYNTGYFSDVRVDRQVYEGGYKVFIFLEEKPIVEEITFSKTRYYKSRALLKKLKIQVGQFLDRKLLKDDVDTIKDLYNKKGLTSAEVEVESFVDDVTNKASLHFVIREGYKIRVMKINVMGNVAFKDKKIQKVMKQKTKGIFRSGYLNEDVVKEDIERIRSFYEQQGYIDIVTDYEIEYAYNGRVEINLMVDEGRRYSVGDVMIVGNDIISTRELQRVMEEIKEGSIFSRDKLTLDIANVRALYFDRGYIFANVNESTAIDPDSGKVDIKFDITEGDVAYVEKVKIEGNTRTRDAVIRRELKLLPGDRFDGQKLKRSKERLNNLGYFEEVNFDIGDTDTYDRKDLVVDVKEAKTGTFSFGGGFSTVDKVVGFIELEQRNFDFTNWPNFTGGGQQLVLRAETGSSRNNYRLSFTEPWIFDRPISGGFDLYKSERDREDDTGYAYDEERLGGGLRFGKSFGEYVRGGINYKLENVEIGNFQPNVSADLLAEAGENTVSLLGFSASRDTRDSVFSPKTGLYVSSGLDVAGGLLGGDKDFWRVNLKGNYYVPLKFSSVLEFRLRTGFVNEYGDSETVPIFERFFAGGARTIRGYDERGVGPQDATTRDPIGGESMLVANIEYTIPVIEYVKFAAFFDTGNVWSQLDDFGSDGFKSGAGLGLRVKTPIGPVSLDYGYPLDSEPGKTDKSGKFYFSVSRGF